jgi:hypothetical protein
MLVWHLSPKAVRIAYTKGWEPLVGSLELLIPSNWNTPRQHVAVEELEVCTGIGTSPSPLLTSVLFFCSDF